MDLRTAAQQEQAIETVCPQAEIRLFCPVPAVECLPDGRTVAVLAHFTQQVLLQSLPIFAALLTRAAHTSEELRADVTALLEQITPHSHHH